MCTETIPDTALKIVDIADYFLHSLDPNYVPMKFEEALAIFRKTFALDTSFRCMRAAPFREFNSDTGKKVDPRWFLAIELMPPDSIMYYNLKDYTALSCQEIVQQVTKRKKTDGSCFCPEFVFIGYVDVQDRRVVAANVMYRVESDVMMDVPEHLLGLENEMYHRLYKWRYENAEYIESKK